jgi:hypothetical protein
MASSNSPFPRDDVSPQLVTIGREVARVRGWKFAATSKQEILNHR